MKYFILALLMVQPTFATICVRAPRVSATEFQEWRKSNPHCENSEETLFTQMQTDADQDLEVLTNKLRKADGSKQKQVAVFRDFFERKKKQAWSKRSVEVVVEVLKRWGNETGSPREIRSLAEQLENPDGVVLEGPRLNDWNDAIIYRDGIEQKAIGGSGQHHWVVFSSLYKPVIHWGTAGQVIEKLKKEKRPWLTGTCEKPQLNFNTTTSEDYLFLFPGGCVATRPSLVIPIAKDQPTITTVAQVKKPFYEKPAFWAITTISAIVVASALKNKTVTIRSAR